MKGLAQGDFMVLSACGTLVCHKSWTILLTGAASRIFQEHYRTIEHKLSHGNHWSTNDVTCHKHEENRRRRKIKKRTNTNH